MRSVVNVQQNLKMYSHMLHIISRITSNHGHINSYIIEVKARRDVPFGLALLTIVVPRYSICGHNFNTQFIC